jgi:hypothetical protein
VGYFGDDPSARIHMANDRLAAVTYENMLDRHVSLRAVAEVPLDFTCIVKAFRGESQPIQALRSADRCHPHRLSGQLCT